MPYQSYHGSTPGMYVQRDHGRAFDHFHGHGKLFGFIHARQHATEGAFTHLRSAKPVVENDGPAAQQKQLPNNACPPQIHLRNTILFALVFHPFAFMSHVCASFKCFMKLQPMWPSQTGSPSSSPRICQRPRVSSLASTESAGCPDSIGL